MAKLVDVKQWTETITKAINAHIQEAIDEEISEAKERLEKALSKEKANIALSVLRNFDLRENREGITITIRDERKA